MAMLDLESTLMLKINTIFVIAFVYFALYYFRAEYIFVLIHMKSILIQDKVAKNTQESAGIVYVKVILLVALTQKFRNQSLLL